MEKVLIGYNFTEFLETAAIYKAAVFDCQGKALFAIVEFFADPKNGALENK